MTLTKDGINCVIVSFLACCVVLTNASGIHATRCRSCDSQQPINGDDCSAHVSNKQYITSRDLCIIRYTVTSSGVKVFKGVSDEQTCTREYKPSCPRQSLVGGGASSPSLPIGTVCSFCCRATSYRNIYCSNEEFPSPETLVTPVPKPGALTTAAVTRKPTHKTTPPTTTKTTTLPTTTSPSSSTVATNGKGVVYPSNLSNKCASCSIRFTGIGVTCHDTYTICSGKTPLCMTSFYDKNGAIHIEKGCASVSDCEKKWWSTTRLNQTCVKEDPYHLTGSWSGICDFCCETKPNDPHWCNYKQFPVAPENPIDMIEFRNRFTTTLKTTTPSSTTTKSTTSTTVSPSTKLTRQSTTSHTSTPATTTQTTTIPTRVTSTITQAKATRSTPSFTTTRKRSTTTTPSTTSSSAGPTTSTNNTGTNKPSTTITTLLSTGTTQSQKSTAKTSGVLCQTCMDDTGTGSKCTANNVHICPAWAPYCVNSIVLIGPGKIHVEKRCASEFECYNDWWLTTRSNPECQGDLNTVTHSGHGKLCRYCCNVTKSNGDACNVEYIPTDLVSFEKHKSTLSTTLSATTLPLSTLSSTKTSLPSKTQTTSSAPTTSSIHQPTSTMSDNMTESTTIKYSGTSSSFSSSSKMATSSTSQTSSTVHIKSSGIKTSYQTGISLTTLSPKTYHSSTRENTSTMPTNFTFTTSSSTISFSTTSIQTSSASQTSNVSSSSGLSSIQPTKPSTISTERSSRSPQQQKTSSKPKPPLSATSSSSDLYPIIHHSTFSYVTRQCVQCGDAKTSTPCSALQLYFSQTKACPNGLNYCMNLVEKKGTKTFIYKSCVDEPTCRLRWYDQSSDDDNCANYKPSASSGDLTCYFCCTSDGCNGAYKPADSTLYRP